MPDQLPPELTYPDQPNFSNDTLYIRVGEENCFEFESFDLNGPGIDEDTLTITARGDIFGGPSLPPPYATLSPTTGTSPLTSTLCWTPSCEFPKGDQHFVIEVVDQNDCPRPNVILDTIHIAFLPASATPPEVRCVSVEGPQTLEVTWNPLESKFLEGFQGYYLYRNDGSGWTQIETFTDPGISGYTDVNAPGADSRPYCYRLSTVKECPDFFIGPPGKSVCSLVPSVSVNSRVIADISWQPYEGWETPSYTVLAEDALSGDEMVLDTGIFAPFYQYLNCNFEGRFRVKLVDPVTGCEVYSAYTQSVIMEDDPPSVPSLCRVSFDNFSQHLKVDWEVTVEDDFESYILFRKGDHESAYTQVFETDDITTNSYIDTDADAGAHSYCYYIQLNDLCGGSARSEEDCSIFLEVTSDRDFNILSEWSPYEGWKNGVAAYEVWRNGEGEANFLTSLDGKSVNYIDRNLNDNQGKYCYQIRAREEGQGCGEVSFSNPVCIILPAKIFMPNAFTPNGDGHNDFFEVKGAFFQTFYIEIFNRWGKKIFTSGAAEDAWDGTYNGRSAPEGVYVYHLRVETVEGDLIERTGSIVLVR